MGVPGGTAPEKPGAACDKGVEAAAPGLLNLSSPRGVQMDDCIAAAPSGRSKCRACRGAIAKAELRFGESTANPYGEGDTHFWYHLHCAALRLPSKLSAALTAHETEVPAREQLLEVARAASSNELLPKVVRADHAPTARARCQKCRQMIDKGSWRIVLERMDEGISSAAGFMHVECASREVTPALLLLRLSQCQPPLTDEEHQQLRAKIEASV